MTGEKLAEIIAKNLRGYRKKFGYSQEDIAEHAELHRTYIGTIERCEQLITIGSLAKLAEGLKKKLQQLLIPSSYKNLINLHKS